MSSFAGPLGTASPDWWACRGLTPARRLSLAALLIVAGPAFADPSDSPQYSAPVRRVADILEKIKSNYVEPIDDGKLVSNAVNGVLHSLDPHSVYLDAQAFRELYNDNRGEYGGLGMEVALQEGRFKVMAVQSGAPAAHAGIQAGDLIVAVDGISTQGKSLEQVIQQVRGKRGTKVELSIERGVDKALLGFVLTRDLIVGRSVWVSLIDSGYAYVRLSQFQVHTPESLVDGLGRFFHQDDTRVAGIVLDLRDNPGGLLSAAVGVSAVFLPAGAPVVFTDGMAKDAKMRLFARSDDYLRYGAVDHLRSVPEELKTLPMVVLVNGGSASAAEIVAGALQDNKRATVLGTHTYGKGSVQVVIPFGDGTGMKLTTAYYHTPSGRVIQDKGVMPDVVVEGQPLREAPAGAGVRPVALDGPRNEAAEHELAAECAPRTAPGPDAATGAGPQSAKSAAARPDAAVDCQLERALEVLRSRLSITRS